MQFFLESTHRLVQKPFERNLFFSLRPWGQVAKHLFAALGLTNFQPISVLLPGLHIRTPLSTLRSLGFPQSRQTLSQLTMVWTLGFYSEPFGRLGLVTRSFGQNFAPNGAGEEHEHAARIPSWLDIHSPRAKRRREQRCFSSLEAYHIESTCSQTWRANAATSLKIPHPPLLLILAIHAYLLASHLLVLKNFLFVAPEAAPAQITSTGNCRVE